jgi:hypothetical protein
LDDVAQEFEEVAALLEALDVEAVWKEASQDERRILVQELVEEVALFPDHLEVVVAGAPRLNVTLEEAGVRNWLVSEGGLERPALPLQVAAPSGIPMRGERALGLSRCV